MRERGSRRYIGSLGALGASVALAASISCDRLLAINGLVQVEPPTAADAGKPQTCAEMPGNLACSACLRSHCCSEWSACTASMTCATYENCALGCGPDNACKARCGVGRVPLGGDTEILNLDQCLATECANDCELTCGITAVYEDPDAAASCTACTATHSCESARGCATDPTCSAIAACAALCVSQDCFTNCTADVDAGTAELYGASLLVNCKTECAIGASWACGGHSTPPFSKSNQTALTLTIQNIDNGQPVAGATVNACHNYDIDCGSPLATGTTDAQGKLTLALPVAIPPYGFQGYFEVSAPTLVPYLFFLEFPLSEPAVTLFIGQVQTPATIAAFYAAAGAFPDPKRGHIDIQAYDCHWIPAPNVTASAAGSDDKTLAFYLVNGAYSASATATDWSGEAVFMNMPIGPTTVEVTPLAVGHPVARLPIFVRAGAVSRVFLRPNL